MLLNAVRKPLLRKIIIYLFLISILPLIVLGIGSHQVYRSYILQKAKDTTLHIATLHKNFVQLQMAQIESLIASISADQTVRFASRMGRGILGDIDIQAARERIALYLDSHSSVNGMTSIDVFTVDGLHLHVGGHRDAIEPEPARIQALIDTVAAAAKPFVWFGVIADPHQPASAEPKVAAATPIVRFDPRHRGSTLVGIVVVYIDPRHFTAGINVCADDMKGTELIIDGNGRILYHPDTGAVGQRLAPSMEFLAGTDTGLFLHDLNGETALITITPFDLAPWRLVNIVSYNEWLSDLSPLLAWMLVILSACLAVALATGALADRRYLAPLRDVIEGFHRLGTTGTASASMLPVRGSDDIAELVRGYNRFLDTLAARERAEQALKESEIRFRTLHSVLQTNVVIHDSDRIFEVNPALTQSSQHTYEDLIGSDPIRLIVPGDRTQFHQAVQARQHAVFDVEGLRKDGSRYAVEWRMQPVPFAGSTAFVSELHDISQRKVAEAKMAAAKLEAEQASRAKSEFLAMMSHEIRTPLNSVIGMAALLLDSASNHEQAVMAKTIRDSGEALLVILNDILDFSKIEAGRLDLANTAFPLDALVEGCVEVVKPRANEKGLPITVAIAPETLGIYDGDAGRIRQILLNILSNAVKFTASGSITLAVDSHENGPAGTQLVAFVVQDTGIGIRKNDIPRLFQLFTQLEAPKSRRFGGTGIGLAITRRLVELMNGTISVESVEGEGSTFRIVLPLKRLGHDERRPERNGAKVAPQGAQLRLRFLIAEDNPVNQQVTLALVRKLGHDGEIVENGADAVYAAKTKTYDMILMDLQMPGMDGFEATRRIRSLPNGSGQVPIIAITAHAFPSDRARCLEAGMNDHVPKPIRLAALSATIRRQLLSRAGERLTGSFPNPAHDPSEANDREARAALRDLAADFGAEGAAQLATVFLNSAPARLAEAHGAFQRSDKEALRHAAQNLKGAAGQIGLTRLAAFSLKLEQSASGTDTEKTADAIAALADALAEVESALRQELDQNPATSVIKSPETATVEQVP